MAPNTDPRLIDRLDNMLPAAEYATVDARINSDNEVATEWAFLQLAVETISLSVIREKVGTVRAAGKTGTAVGKTDRNEPAVVRSMFARNAIRIAVAAVLILGASAVYNYSIVSGVSIYNSSFSGYELGIGRGNETGDKLEAAYQARDWSGVLNAFDVQPVKNNKSNFLAGMTALELKKYPLAVQHFQAVVTNNSKTGENYFQAESEYYLALACLRNNQNAKGLELLKKIRSDIYHPYYPLASKISGTDLKIVELKK